MSVKWRIHYEDGSTFSSEDGTFQQAPSFGVLCVVCDKDELVLGGDIVGLIDYLCRIGLVKFGRMTDNQTYECIMNPVRNDKYPTLGYDRIINEGNDYYWWMGDLK